MFVYLTGASVSGPAVASFRLTKERSEPLSAARIAYMWVWALIPVPMNERVSGARARDDKPSILRAASPREDLHRVIHVCGDRYLLCGRLFAAFKSAVRVSILEMMVN